MILFSPVRRRPRIDDTWFRIDLVFLHRRLRYLVIADLLCDRPHKRVFCGQARYAVALLASLVKMTESVKTWRLMVLGGAQTAQGRSVASETSATELVMRAIALSGRLDPHSNDWALGINGRKHQVRT
jgi:hypothetical protein